MKILGARPFCARPSKDREAAKTKELVVENREIKTTALTIDGKAGIPNRFIAAAGVNYYLAEKIH